MSGDVENASALALGILAKTRYCNDTSSTLKLVGNVMSLVPRN